MTILSKLILISSVMTLMVSALILRWQSGKMAAGLLFAELNEIVETAIRRDYLGALYGYQSHLAAGHRMKVPAILGFEIIGTLVFKPDVCRLSILGAKCAAEVVEFHAGLQRIQHDLRSIIGDQVSPPESIAAWLSEDIRLWSELEVQGASLLTELEEIARASLLTFAKKSIRLSSQ